MSRKFESAAKLPLFFRSAGPVRSPERGCFLSKAQRPCRQQEHSCGSAAAYAQRGQLQRQPSRKPIRKQLATAKPEKRELFEQRHSRELILYDAAARYLKELKDSGEEITPKAWQREIDQLTAGKQVDTIDMKAMREELKAVERLRKAADQLARQEQDKSHDRGPER